MEPGSTGPLVFAFFLVLGGAFFSMSETAMMSVNRLAMRHMAESGNKSAKIVEKILGKKERFISSVLIGNNLVTILVSTMVAAFAINLATEENEALYLTIATFVTTVVVIIFGDIIPKVMASKFTQKVALFSARPLQLVMLVFYPFTVVLDLLINRVLALFGSGAQDTPVVTEQEVLTMLEMGHEAGIIAEEQSQMIDAVFEFRKALARDVMIPRRDIAAVAATATYNEVVEAFRTERFSRLPVYKENLDDIIGILNFKDLMFAEVDAEDFEVERYMRAGFLSYEQQSTQTLFTNMRRDNASMAIILDEYGGCAGLVTLEDLVETIMGEIFDEHDDEKEDDITIITPGAEYEVLGALRIDEFNKKTGATLKSENYDSIAGYAIGLFGYIPKAGEQIEEGNITFVVEEVGKNRIESLRIKISNTDNLEVRS